MAATSARRRAEGWQEGVGRRAVGEIRAKRWARRERVRGRVEGMAYRDERTPGANYKQMPVLSVPAGYP